MPLQSAASPLGPLADPALWEAYLRWYAEVQPRRAEKLATFREVVADGSLARAADDVLAGRHRFEPPRHRRINKADGRKKDLYLFGPRDELVLRLANRLLQPVIAPLTSERCHSFLPGRGARTAIRTLLADPDLPAKGCLRLDVSDYFASIDPRRCLADLPPALMADEPTARLLEAYLAGDLGRGVLPGSPLAPVLGNLHLLELDESFAGTTYARYADDVIVFGTAAEVDDHRRRIEAALAERGLRANLTKTEVVAPGQPWDYLGVRRSGTTTDLGLHTRVKLKARARRLAARLERSGLPPEERARKYVRKLHRKLYGTDAERGDFCWADWFFPVLTADAGLAELDQAVQAQARYAATGLRTDRGRKRLPYSALRELGYVPLRSAFWAWRRDPVAYDRLVHRA